MTTYPDSPRLTMDDLDPESATTDRLIAMVRSHREGEEYPHTDSPDVLTPPCVGAW